MTGIVIGAGPDSIHGILTARSLGHEVVAVDGDGKSPGLQYANYRIVADLKEASVVICELEELERSEGIRPDFMIPVPIGRYLVTSCIIRDHYGFKGLGYESGILCTDKHLFHEEMSKDGLRQTDEALIHKGRRVKDIGELFPDKASVGFPLIMKPRHGSGSRGVRRLGDASEFTREVAYKLPFDEDYVIEGVIKGKEYGIDGVVIKGRFTLLLLREKVMTPPPSCQCVAYMNVVRSGHASNGDTGDMLYQAVGSYMERVVRALKMEDCLLHGDLMIEVADSVKVNAIEISGRPSGHRLHDVFTPVACGVDMVREFIRYCCGEGYDFTPVDNPHMVIRYFDFENCKIKWQPDIEDLKKEYDIVKYICEIKDEYLGPVTDGHSIMGRGYFILVGETAGDVLRKSQEILDMFVKEWP